MELVLIQAGGKGERLKPLTEKVPKPMVQIAGKPLLEHLLNFYKKAGYEEFIFSLCYLPDEIQSYFADGKKWGVKIQYTFEDFEKPLGTAGALGLARDKLRETFVVTSGDVLRNLDIKQLVREHKSSGATATIALYKNFKEHPTSMVELDQDGFVTRFVERPNKKQVSGEYVWSNASLYVLEPKVVEFIPEGQFVDFGYHVFPKLIEAGEKVYGFAKDYYLLDIGTIEKLKQAEQDIKNGVFKI